MRFSAFLSALVLAAPSVICHKLRGKLQHGWERDPDDARSSGSTKKFMVEVAPGADVTNLGHRLKAAPSPGNNHVYAFDCGDIFVGLSLETDTENVDSLRNLPGVTNVWPLKSVPLPKTTSKRRFGPGQVPGNYSLHQWTGVDRLHKKGVRGKGATVAVIDTGVDYTHSALGGCFGPGCKIAGGYDLVGFKWDAHNIKNYPKRPDDDPKDGYGHGTHVAGIVAGENSWFTGVAPDAEILSYKVFADDPYDTDEETLIQAFCDAYSSGADVITASIGRPNGFTDNPWALIASRIVDKGVVVTISAGNEGYTGPFYGSSGSVGRGVLAVAAVNVSSNPRVDTNNPKNVPIPAYFTTWGPTNELSLKPDIGAPGYSIMSTWLNQTFKEESGTSMAAPYIAGVAALFIGKHGGREIHGPDFGKWLGKRIISSGKSVAWGDDPFRLNTTAPPFQVGTGLVDAWKVLEYTSEIAFEPFALLDTELFRPRWRAKISNKGNTTVTYNFALEPQAGVEIFDADYGVSTVFNLRPKTIVPRVNLPRPVKIKPGKSKTVEFEFEQPEGLDDDKLPLYGGKVWIQGDNGEYMAIPYGGAAYDTEKAFDSMFSTEPFMNTALKQWRWSFNPDKDPFDFANLNARLNYPCFHLRWDIYTEGYRESRWSWPPQVGENGYIGAATTMRDAEMYWYYDPETMDKHDTIAFPLMRVPRGFRNYWWFGKMANGSHIAPGNYSMRFAALRPYGNPAISDHWDVMVPTEPSFEVLSFNGTNATSFNTRMSVSAPTPPSKRSPVGLAGRA